MNPHPEPTAPDAASESAIERVFRACHEAALTQDADKIAGLYAVDGVIETPPPCFRRETWALAWSSAASRSVPSSKAPSRPAAAKEPSRTGWRTGTYLTDGHQLTWEYPRQTPTGEQTRLVESTD